MPMHYLFADESYPPPGEKTNIVVAVWSVGQDSFNRYFKQATDFYKTPILANINSIFESLDAWGVVATASLEPSLFRSGEIDRTYDIDGMSRRDNIWSQSLIFTVGLLVKELLHRNQEPGTLDLFFDPKSLREDHEEAWFGTLRSLVVKQAKRYAEQFGLGNEKALRIRRVVAVAKAEAGKDRNKFQTGTWVADKLCSNSKEIARTGKFNRVTKRDISDAIRRSAQQFDGKRFEDD